MFQMIIDNYSQFFNLANFEGAFTVNGILTILLLVMLEGLLSADNALVLAMMVKHLPEKDRGHALTWGIWGAYLFRFIVIGVGTLLIKLWYVKAIGALYLFWMAFKGLTGNGDEDSVDESKYIKKGLWATIISVECMDIVFSIDSITAALAISDKVWVLFLGALLGILMMREVAKVFVVLLEKVPELEKTAYVLIDLIGLKLGGTLLHIEVNDILFFVLMFGVFFGTFVVSKIRKQKVTA